MSLERRVPLNRASEGARRFAAQRSRLPNRSRKQASKDRELAAMRVIVLERDDYTCQLSKLMAGHHCSGRLHVHHRRLRSQGGTHDLSNLLTLCDAAHRYAHANPAEAALFGVIELRPDAGEAP